MLKPNIEDVKNTLEEFAYPADIIIEVTRHCNLRCIMCPYPNLKRPQGNMSFSTYKKIIDETVQINKKTRIWLAIMGEPLLLGNDLPRFIEYAKKMGIEEICLNTNAVFLDNKMAQQLIASGIDKILISIDASTQDTYDKIRVGGDFYKVVKNVENILLLKKNGPDIIVQFIVMDENENELQAFKDFWLSKNAIVKIRPKLGWGNAIKADNLDSVAKTTERFPCAWLTRTVSIHWDGSFSQCDADHEGVFSPGHLDKNTIKEVWDTILHERRIRHWNKDFDFKPCSECKDWLAGRSYFYYPQTGEQQ